MTLISLRRTSTARAGLLLILPVIAGCTAPVEAPAPVTAPHPVAPAIATPPGNQQGMASPDGSGKPPLFNDPPASADTPLCGHQAQEINAIGATLQGPRVLTSGVCASFACYDPLTATYIGADGYRHVCR